MGPREAQGSSRSLELRRETSSGWWSDLVEQGKRLEAAVVCHPPKDLWKERVVSCPSAL